MENSTETKFMVYQPLNTNRRSEMINISRQLDKIIEASNIKEGLCHVYSPHTTAGITINEAADPDVVTDMISYFDTAIPWNNNYRHGEGNSAAHIKTTLTGTSVQIPITRGKLALGTWQGVFFCEWDGPRSRKYTVSILKNQ